MYKIIKSAGLLRETENISLVMTMGVVLLRETENISLVMMVGVVLLSVFACSFDKARAKQKTFRS